MWLYFSLPEIVADVSQLIRVFQNLISNGLKYRGEARPRVRVDAELEEGNWLFSVKDNGIDIGLAICRRIIRRHGGTIWVESEPVKGSEFYSTIPQRESP
jgi:signal transduction histidine kinase